MKNLMRASLTVILVLSSITGLYAQNANHIQRYVEQYRNLAMSEQQRTGIPAAIKLAQAIHESGAGTSDLAKDANNHFGLKCKSGWTGPTYNKDDDRPNECFRKYNIDFESFQDHSNYLKGNPRYASLFQLSQTDYAAWAYALRRAGYATNPQYPQLLINIIETYKLQQYTYAALGNAIETNSVAATYTAPASEPTQQYQTQNTQPTYTQQNSNTGNNSYRSNVAAQTPVAATPAPVTTTPPNRYTRYDASRASNTRTTTRQRQQQQPAQQKEAPSTVVTINNLKAIYGKKGDMPLQYAVRNNIRYQKFLEINDLKEEPLPADMPLYLERKHFWGVRPMHLVKPGETMLVIAQQEGIQLKYLLEMNLMEEGEEPIPGITLELQTHAAEKPKLLSEMEVKNEEVASRPKSTWKPNPMQRDEKFDDSKEEGVLGLGIFGTKKKSSSRNYSRPKTVNPAARPQPAAQRTAPPANTNVARQTTQPTTTNSGVSSEQLADQIINDSKQSDGYTHSNVQATNPRYNPQARANTSSQPYNTNPRYVDPNTRQQQQPIAVQREPEMTERERRRAEKRAAKEEPVPTYAQPQPVQQQQPKTELDMLKDQFDEVIYSDQAGSPDDSPYNTGYEVEQRDPSKYYTVKEGDTAYSIAKQHGISVRQLMEWNKLDFDAIKVGEELRVKQ